MSGVTYEITSPDGKKFRITAPEGTTREQALERVMKEQSAFTKKDDRYDENVGGLDYVLDRVRGVPGGFAALIGGPGPLSYAAAKLAGKDPMGVSKAMSKGVNEAMGVKGLKPPDPMTHWAGDVAEFATSGLPLTAGIVAKAPGLLAKTGALVTDATQSVLGGTGMTLGRESGVPHGETIGALLGGVTGTALPAIGQFGAELAAKGINILRGNPGKELRNAMGTDAAANMARADDVADDVVRMGGEGFNPTVSARTGSRGVASIEEQVIKSSPERLERAIEVRSGNEAALSAATDKSIGKRVLSDEQISSMTRQQLDANSRALDVRMKSLDELISGVGTSVQGKGKQATGDELYSLYQERLNVARGQKNAKYENVYRIADESGFKTGMGDVVDEVKTLKTADENAFQKLPGVFHEIVSRYGAKEGKEVVKELPRGRIKLSVGGEAAKDATFRDLHSLWKRAELDAQMASRSGDAYALHYLAKLKQSLKSKLDAVEQGGHGALTAAFKDANDWYRTAYAPAFKEGVGGMMGARKRFGEYVKPEDVAERFFSPSGADDYAAIFGSDPKAMEVMKDGILGMFAKKTKVVTEGRIDVDAAKRFIAEHSETIAKFPEVKAALENPTKLTAALADRAARLAERGKIAARGALNDISGNPRASEEIARMVDAGDKKGLLNLTAIQRQDVRETVARVVADAIPAAASRRGMTPLEFVVANEQMIKPVMNMLSPNHFNNLKKISEARTILDRGAQIPQFANAGARRSGLEAAIGTSEQSLLNMLRVTMVTRAAGTHGMATVLAGKFLNLLRSRNADKVLERAMYDKDFARDLAMAAEGRGGWETLKRLEGHTINLGLKTAVADGEQ